jgi:hypothetical protein
MSPEAHQLPASSVHPSEHFTCVDGLAFLCEEALDDAGFGRADFILHFHSFDNEEPLAGLDGVAGLDEKANDFAGHGGNNLLAAFGFKGAVTTAAPGAGIEDFGGEFLEAGLQGEHSAGRGSDTNFVRLAAKKDGEGVGRDFDSVGVERLTVECDAPMVSVVFELDDVDCARDADFKFHDANSKTY